MLVAGLASAAVVQDTALLNRRAFGPMHSAGPSAGVSAMSNLGSTPSHPGVPMSAAMSTTAAAGCPANADASLPDSSTPTNSMFQASTPSPAMFNPGTPRSSATPSQSSFSSAPSFLSAPSAVSAPVAQTSNSASMGGKNVVDVSDGNTTSTDIVTGHLPSDGVGGIALTDASNLPSTPPSLRQTLDAIDAAKPGGFKLGLESGPNPSEFVKARLKDTFNLVVAGNECKPDATEQVEGKFDLTRCKQVKAAADEANASFRVHTLMWHNQRPKWMHDTSLSKDDIKNKILPNHATGVVTGMGQVYSTDVMNEVVADIGGALPANVSGCVTPKAIWPNTVEDKNSQVLFGGDLSWMEPLVSAAKKPGTGGQLLINDYNTGPMNTKTKCVIELFKQLKPFGLDGIGFQMHIGAADAPTKAQMAETFKVVADAGGVVAITELDVDTHSNSALLTKQAIVYGDLLDACLEAPNCHQFVVWGLTDQESWLKPQAAALLYDQEKPKQAIFEIQARLERFHKAMGKK
ncbi:hypothetical protein PYCC9005_002279 [Savitreella phatthalungensis]